MSLTGSSSSLNAIPFQAKTQSILANEWKIVCRSCTRSEEWINICVTFEDGEGGVGDIVEKWNTTHNNVWFDSNVNSSRTSPTHLLHCISPNLMTTTNIDDRRDPEHIEFAPEIASALFRVYLFLFSSTSIGLRCLALAAKLQSSTFEFCTRQRQGCRAWLPNSNASRKYLPFYHQQQTLNLALRFLYSFAKHSKLSIELIFIAFAFVCPLRLTDGEHERWRGKRRRKNIISLLFWIKAKLCVRVIFSSSKRENAGSNEINLAQAFPFRSFYFNLTLNRSHLGIAGHISSRTTTSILCALQLENSI